MLFAKLRSQRVRVSSTMLAGRAFQGVGSGVILSLVEIVVSDIVSLSERYVSCAPRSRGISLMYSYVAELIRERSVASGHWHPQQVR